MASSYSYHNIGFSQETIILRERSSALMSVRCSWRLGLFLVTSPSRARNGLNKRILSREQTVSYARAMAKLLKMALAAAGIARTSMLSLLS